MITTHNLGFPRIGIKRELKFALEKHWRGEQGQHQLLQIAQDLRRRHWRCQAQLDFVPVGDFSLYDQVLDTSFMLGNIPDRVRGMEGNDLDNYFRVSRGRCAADSSAADAVSAGEMTKWFDTNYHYIVPEFDEATTFSLNSSRLLRQIDEAREEGVTAKPVIVGPVTYLWLGRSKDETRKLDFLEDVLSVYGQLLIGLERAGVEWVQIDEPVLVMELSPEWRDAVRKAYQQLHNTTVKIMLTTYFAELHDNLQLACELPVDGLHLDAVNAGGEVNDVMDRLNGDKVLSLGIIDGRNIWKTDLATTLDWLEPIHEKLQERLWLAPSCSLLHVPVDLRSEQKLDDEIHSWLAFAIQKLDELTTVTKALNEGREAVSDRLSDNATAINSRKQSGRVHNAAVNQRAAEITAEMGTRDSPYQERAAVQRARMQLPLYPTTTIGSFPQTAQIRLARKEYRTGTISEEQYRLLMQEEIKTCVREQEDLGLDVLVHGEPERNDMVEYFGEQLAGYAITQAGWVQSYGSRCVKPPIIYGDISRPKTMTVEWIKYATSIAVKPMKGIITGPVTMLNWSFVRDDQPRSATCLQLALALRDEVLDLERADIPIIQIDEAALREGLPLRKSQWKSYLEWAIRAFRITANGVRDETQIHTHMCYSEFSDIIEAIANMDADVISIETSRSDMRLLDVFDAFRYPNEIGPGVYDIHSPNTPSVESMVALMQKARRRIPAERLWVNPDCGLKTRTWEQVRPALARMIQASKILSSQSDTVAAGQ